LLSNESAENYQNWFVIVKALLIQICDGLGTHCSYNKPLTKNCAYDLSDTVVDDTELV